MSEIETMARQLRYAGHELVEDVASADQIILNTCAVTSAATSDTRQAIRQFHQTNPQAEIIVTGCHATLAPNEVGKLAGVSRIVLNQDKDRLVQIIDPQASLELPIFDREPLEREISQQHTRAFIKVQDGCKNRCTFCVTTIARGESQSRPMADIVNEIQTLHQLGYQEAVLTGVHLGSYGHDFGNGAGLRELVRLILTHTDMPRLRLSSLEPWDIADRFFDLWEDRRLLPHLHTPLQSGCDRTLRRMARKTTQASFRELVNSARAAIPDLNLTTDLIVGFPGETEEEFAESYQFVQEIGFSRLHVFPYSPRPQTAAAQMPHQLPKATKKERVSQMIALGKEMGEQFHTQHNNREMTVLWEGLLGADENGLRWAGYTDNYIRVVGYGSAEQRNTLTLTRLHSAHADGIQGTILAPL